MRAHLRWWVVIAALIMGIGVVSPEAQGRFWVLVNGALRYTGTVTVSGPLTVTGLLTPGNSVQLSDNTQAYYWSGRAVLRSPGNGVVTFANFAETIGSEIKTDALPTVSSGFGTSPAITAGSTPLAGSINVGTGVPGTGGVINFNGTAFPSNPFVVCMDDTSLLIVRCTATTTQLTIAATALTASDIVSWIAISAK